MLNLWPFGGAAAADAAGQATGSPSVGGLDVSKPVASVHRGPGFLRSHRSGAGSDHQPEMPPSRSAGESPKTRRSRSGSTATVHSADEAAAALPSSASSAALHPAEQPPAAASARRPPAATQNTLHFGRPKLPDAASDQLYDLLAAAPIDLGETDASGVRAVVWRGVTHKPLRPFAWRAMLHYPHSSSSSAGDGGGGSGGGYAAALERRLSQYRGYITKYFDPRGVDGRSERLPQEQAILHQIAKDLPRHQLSLYHCQALSTRLERMLFIWSVRHPATSYVQGFDDIVAVFFTTFVTERLALAMARHRQVSRDTASDRHRSRLVSGRLHSRSRNASMSNLDAGGGSVASVATDPMASSGSSHPCSSLTQHHPERDELSALDLSEQMAAGCSASLWDAASSVVHNLGGVPGARDINDALARYNVTDAVLDRAETDTFYCAGQLLEWVQHHYIHGTPGINAAMADVEALVQRADPEFAEEMLEAGVACQSFLYKWVHCFLIRFIPPALAPRLMDTLLAIGQPFPHFLVYMCAALLLQLKPRLTGRPMEEMLLLLQHPTVFDGAESDGSVMAAVEAGLQPVRVTAAWLDTLVSEAFLLSLRDTAKTD
jgi:hypothetical protein